MKGIITGIKNHHLPSTDIRTANQNVRVAALKVLNFGFHLVPQINRQQRVHFALVYGLWLNTGKDNSFWEYEKMAIDMSRQENLQYDEKLIFLEFLKESCNISDPSGSRIYKMFYRKTLVPKPTGHVKVAGVTREKWFRERTETFVEPGMSIPPDPVYTDIDITTAIERYIVEELHK